MNEYFLMFLIKENQFKFYKLKIQFVISNEH
ncbi:MAG: hypothetical protein JWQ54_1462 [Mucilaginibacter sp.]|jgi:hypothetical protein|nr:hypothetical protein [Mucilaginibacter sp.]